jgi:hypothetical protein
MLTIHWIHRERQQGWKNRKTINVAKTKRKKERKKERTRELKDRLIGEANHEKYKKNMVIKDCIFIFLTVLG